MEMQPDLRGVIETVKPHQIEKALEILHRPSEIIATPFRTSHFQGEFITAVHNTVPGSKNPYGKTLGGTRIVDVQDEKDPRRLANDLAVGMTWKHLALFAMLEKDYAAGKVTWEELRSSLMGGSKTVVRISDAKAFGELDSGDPRRREVFEHYGDHIEQKVKGKAITAIDLGARPEDMAVVRERTDYVVGYPESRGGTGDPSPTTAIGVLAGMRALRERLKAEGTLRGDEQNVHAIQGVGHVGRPIALALLRNEPMSFTYFTEPNKQNFSDTFEQVRTTIPNTEWGRIMSADPKQYWLLQAGIFIPCAGPNVLTEAHLQEMVETGTVKLVCGSFNDPYPTREGRPDPKLVQMYYDAGITVAPAELVNLGGILHVSSKFWKEWGSQNAVNHHQRTAEIVQGVAPFALNVYEMAQQEGVPMETIFSRIVARQYAAFCIKNNIALR